MKDDVKICANCKHVDCLRGTPLSPRSCNHDKAFISKNIVSGAMIYKSCQYMRDNRICGLEAKLYEQP